MARKFYTCIIIPNAGQGLHKLRVPIKGLYVLAIIGALSFFAAVGLGFHYIGMATRMSGYENLEAENAQLKVNTRQLQLSTAKLNKQVIQLENEAEKIAKALADDPVLKRIIRTPGSVGGSKADVSTLELEGNLPTNMEEIRQRMDIMEKRLSLLDKGTQNLRSTPRIWPVTGGHVGSHYGSRLDPFTGESEVHLGIDIIVPKGTPIKASADGVVIYAAWQGDYGNLIVLQHPNGFTTRYAHLSKVKIKVNDIVKREDIVGLVGATGRTTAAHLHYEVRRNDHAVDPRPYLIN